MQKEKWARTIPYKNLKSINHSENFKGMRADFNCKTKLEMITIITQKKYFEEFLKENKDQFKDLNEFDC